MKIVEINSVCGTGSTGKICVGVAEVAKDFGYECKIAYGRMKALPQYEEIGYRIGSDFGVKIHALKSRIFGNTGTYSKSATKKFLKWLDTYSPDIIHLHNLHGYYINVPMLFDYIKRKDIRTIWTLHDCWAFTGHCAYFDMAACDKWSIGCSNCPQKKSYPQSFIDDSKKSYRIKKETFCGVKDMTIVTPSKWLGDLTKRSFLGEYPLRVINNGIDLNTFCPTESDLKERLNCKDKKIVLGVAFQWGATKGLDVFMDLARRLSDDYRIVLIGVDKTIVNALPDNITAVERTHNQSELAQYYSVADVFVNPTRQENFPTVNIEALACGTPVVTFDTGGSPEIIDESCGVTVKKNDIAALEERIKEICENNIFSAEACVAAAGKFDYKDKFKQYVDLYSEKRS